MRIWVAYRFSDADRRELKRELAAIRAAFEAKGHSVSTMIEDIQRWGKVKMTKVEAIRELKRRAPEHDALVCFYFGAEPSSGRSWEAGLYDGMGKPTVLAVPLLVTLREYEYAMFKSNEANLPAKLPYFVRYMDYDEVAAALGV